ncbi:MAG: Gx transporter family protein [Clostridia bacterium]|nr:Gx transporter family protein [Clostridia bacterium]
MPGKAKRLALDAMLLGAALILSWLESMLPMPLPGFRLGLGNIAIVLTARLVSRADGLAVLILRVAVTSLLFGSVTTFAFSLAGGLLAWGVTALLLPLYGRISLIGVSILAAGAHNLGQVFAACAMFASASPLAMLWWLLLLAVPAGALTGALAEVCVRRVRGVRRGGTT